MLYENLPGINVTLKDGGLIIPDAGGSESILIIAPCLTKDSPDEPVLVRSSTELIQYGFGDFYVNGEVNPIAAEWKSATDGGAKVVYLLPLKEITKDRAAELEQAAITAATSKGETLASVQARITDVLKGNTATAALRRKFVYFYDVLMSDLLDFSVDHVVVKGVTVEDEVTSLDAAFFPEVPNILEDFPFVGGMVTSSYVLQGQAVQFPLAITASSNDKLVIKVGGADVTLTVPAKTYNGVELGISDLATDLQSLINKNTPALKAKVRADNGKLVFYFAETAVVQAGTTAVGLGVTGSAVLQKTNFGLITKGSFAQTVADYCQTKTLMRDATIGYIGVKSPIDTKVSTIRKYVEDLMKLDTEISPYLQVIASEIGVIMPVTNSVHYINGATQYAALLSTLKKSSAPTNKALRGVKAVRFNYSLRQLSRLTGKKLVTFRIKDGTELVVTDGVTTAPSIVIGGVVRDSDFARVSTLRIAQLAITVVREAVDPFIGEANGMPEYNALNTAVKSALETIREAGAITGYKFTIANVTSRMDEATVLLEIVPAFELRRVELQVNLSPSEALFGLS